MIEIEFRNVGKSFVDRQTSQARAAVTNVNLSIRSGEVVSIIGPSGCGKSTLLNMGAGLYLPTEGEVFVSGQKVTKPVRKVAFMLQKDLLMPWRDIRANVSLGLEIDGVSAAERKRVADELLARCHLKGFEEHYPYQLSGGMRQRAALRARWRWIRKCCCSMSLSRHSMRKPRWCCNRIWPGCCTKKENRIVYHA